MRTLITGATGFVGGHLAECLLAVGDEVHAVARRSAWPADLQHLAPNPLHSADLLNLDRMAEILADVKPDRIAHLAGYADAGGSFRDPDGAWAGNLTATRVLYDSVARSGQSPRILFVSTGQVYGPAGRFVNESAELQPASPYSASKAAADLLSFQMTRHPGLKVIRVRPFNQLGPRQPPQYAAGHFAKELARIEAGLAPPRLEVGDLSASRDLTDVRDMVESYRLLLDLGRPGEVYNAGSGVAVQMAEVLDLLRAECRVTPEVVQKPERMRPAEAGATIADARKLRHETGWSPRFDLRQTLRDTLDSWRARVGSEPEA
jgi:GDP-4-dehydro-6-deoxy-D-mannose reductase